MKKKYTYLIVIFLIVTSFIAYARILGNGFVNFDDNGYIIENNHIKSGINPESIKWAFSAVVCSNWHPLTWLSHMLDWSLFKDHAGGHHLISLLLHIGTALLLFLFLNRMTKNLWSSAFVAALFALHPLRVESVAWAAERKDVLSMFFGLASIYAYAYYTEKSQFSKYFLCLILFALSLMAKPMLVTLPFVLLLLDYWPLGRWQKALNPLTMQVDNTLPIKNEGERCNVDPFIEKEISAPIKSRGYLVGRLLGEKAPFIFLTIGSSIVTLWVQNKGGAVASMEHLPFSVRVLNAIISYVSYLGKTFWPVDLAVIYPYEHSFAIWQILAFCFILIGITIVVIYAIKKLPFLFVGWFWYWGTLIPVIGLVQVGAQAMADRYTYLPSIGIAIMLVWGIPLLFQREEMRKKILFPAGIAYLAILAVLTWQQCGYWKNSFELFNYTLHITKDNTLAHNNLGFTLFAEGKIEEAIDNYNEAIRLKPDYADVYNNRGLAYSNLGQYKRAIEDYNEAIRLKPDYADAYYNRGLAYSNLDQYKRAIENYNEAIRLKPDYAEAYCNRGNAYLALGQYQHAIKDYNEAIQLKPDLVQVYTNRGYAYFALGQYQRAIEDYIEAIRLKPDYADAYSNRGIAYNKLGQYQRAFEDFNEAIRLKPDDAKAYNNRGYAYLLQGNNKLGCRDAQKACAMGVCKALVGAKGKGLCR